MSRFDLQSSLSLTLREQEFFVPGIWYLENRHVPARALAADLSEEYFLIREDRMPLPLVMMRNKQTGATLTLIHSRPNGATCLEDYSADRVVDARLQFAALGVFSQQDPALALLYPGTEGERSYLAGGRGRADVGAGGGGPSDFIRCNWTCTTPIRRSST